MLKRHLAKWHRPVLALLTISLVYLYLMCWCCLLDWRQHSSEHTVIVMDDDSENRQNFTSSNNVTGYLQPIVPNIVHFIRFDNPVMDFHDMLAILAAHRHQKPDKILLHCNFPEPTGPYWNRVKNISEVEVRFMSRPTQLFGELLSTCHAMEVARMFVLMVHGGILLDNDVYIVQSMDAFRHFEFAIGWPLGELPSTRVLVANKDARFLRLWYNAYRDYHPKSWCWYFGAKEQPPISVLVDKPELAHRVPELFGVRDVTFSLYSDNSPIWRDYYSISLRRDIACKKFSWDYFSESTLTFDDVNIKMLNSTFAEMARLAIHGTVS